MLVVRARVNPREFRNWLRDIGVDKIGFREKIYDALLPVVSDIGV
jgi:hypothetical protein